MKEKIKEIQEKLRNQEKLAIKQQERYSALEQKHRECQSLFNLFEFSNDLNLVEDSEPKSENPKHRRIDSANLNENSSKKKGEEIGKLEVPFTCS